MSRQAGSIVHLCASPPYPGNGDPQRHRRSGDTRVHALTEDDLAKLREWIDSNYQVEGDLRREVAADIRRKIEIGCYQGIRHRKGLPVHGQRTQTNARTRKGKKKTSPARRRPERSNPVPG